MAPDFMTLRRGSTFRMIEKPEGDYSSVQGMPTAWLVLADDRGKPQFGAPHLALQVTFDTDRWIMTLLNTVSLTSDRYLAYSRYVFADESVYIPDPTLLIVKD